MSKPNLLAIWAKHERGEGATNGELGHLIERFESLQDRLEQAEREAKAAKGVITQHITERSLETHRNVGIAVDEAVKAVVQLLIEDPSRRAREAEAAVARVRELHSVIPVKVNFDQLTADYCDFCGDQEYPCPTIRALDGETNEV